MWSRRQRWLRRRRVVTSTQRRTYIASESKSVVASQRPATEGVMPNYSSRLIQNMEVIARSLVVTDLLLAKLMLIKYFKDKMSDIEMQPSAQEKVDKLISVLRAVPHDQLQSVFTDFVTILRKTGQGHVANMFRPESNARPMSDKHYRLLVRKQQQVCQCIAPMNGLVDELVAREVFSDLERCKVLSTNDDQDKSREIINILARKQNSAFCTFISALVATNQEHASSLLGHDTMQVPLTDEHRQMLISKTEELSQFINPCYSLVSRLVACDVFSKREMDIITSKPISYTERSIELVNVLLRKSDSSFEKFIEALNNTEQQHVVHILTGQGESPLSRVRRLVLRKARDRLVSRIDSIHTSLMPKLISNGVLTDDDKQRIEAHSVNEARTAELIDVIARKSQLAYDRFIQVLKDSGHCQLAEELAGLELRGHIDPHFLSGTPPVNKTRTVQAVRNDMKAMFSGRERGIEEITSLMEQNGFAVSDISEGSIHISFRCFGEESLVNLKRLLADKTLDRLFTQVFCPQFAEQGLESLTLHVADDEFDKLSETFGQMKGDNRTDDPSNTATDLPVELLELVLMKTFSKLFTDRYKSHYNIHEAIRMAYSTLAAVCSIWWQTMNGWPQSPTKHWLKHKLHRAVKYVCRPYVVSPHLQSSLPVPGVFGVTVCDGKLFAVCSDKIRVFGPNNEQLTDIELRMLRNPTDIVSCSETRQLYVADWTRHTESFYCVYNVWRVSLDGRQVVKWLPNKSTTTSQFRPHTMSVTSRRLLVTSIINSELVMYGADGVELKRVPLPNTMTSLQHAVETSRGTFIVSHEKPQPRVCEVNVDGHVTRVYCDQQQLSDPVYLSLDSDGRIFVADNNKHRVLLLNSETLELERVLLDTQQHQLTQGPRRLCCVEQTQQLAVASHRCIQLFTVR